MKKVKVFDVVDILVMMLLAALTVIPFIVIVSKAISDPAQVTAGNVKLFPKGLQFGTIQYVLGSVEVSRAFLISVFVTFVGTAIALLLNIITAYPLSKPELRGRKPILYLFVFTMLFNGGMIPNYLLYRSLHLINTVWALIVGSVLLVARMFVIKNYFERLPEAVEEAARIDGANWTNTLFRVVVPMSKPVLATITLFYAVGYWNSYFAGVMYISKPELRTLQHFLYEVIQLSKKLEKGGLDVTEAERIASMSSECITAATIVISTVPILIVYPLLQKHFVKGITIGSVKG